MNREKYCRVQANIYRYETATGKKKYRGRKLINGQYLSFRSSKLKEVREWLRNL